MLAAVAQSLCGGGLGAVQVQVSAGRRRGWRRRRRCEAVSSPTGERQTRRDE